MRSHRGRHIRNRPREGGAGSAKGRYRGDEQHPASRSLPLTSPRGSTAMRGIPLGVAVKATHTYTYGSSQGGPASPPRCHVQREAHGHRHIGLPSSAHEESPAMSEPCGRRNASGLLSGQAPGGAQGHVRPPRGHCRLHREDGGRGHGVDCRPEDRGGPRHPRVPGKPQPDSGGEACRGHDVPG